MLQNHIAHPYPGRSGNLDAFTKWNLLNGKTFRILLRLWKEWCTGFGMKMEVAG